MGEIASLNEMPNRCPLANEAESTGFSIRQLLYGRYRVVFRIYEEEKAVHILAVRHSARDALSEDEVRQN